MSATERHDTNPTNKWIIGGGIGLLAAAAAVGFVVISSDSTDTIRQDPAVTVAADPAPTSPTPTTSPTATTTADSVVPPVSPAPTPEPSVTTVQPTTTPAPPPVPAESPAALTTAGSSGVTVGVPDGSESLIVSEPMGFATTARDGRVFMQRAPVQFVDPTADTTMLVWTPATGELTPLDPPLAADSVPGSTVELHDVATIDGAVTLLYEVSPGNCPNPTGCIGAIMAWSPDTGESTEVASKNVWEGGWSGLELAENGLIVGTQSESASSGIFLASIGSVTMPSLGDIGLDESYFDCDRCPFAYSIDSSGRFIGWVDSGEGVDTSDFDPNALPSRQIAIVDIADGGGFASQRVVADVSGAYADLDIADIVFGDEGFVDGHAVFLAYGTASDGTPIRPVQIDLSSGEIGQIDAVTATLNELDR